MIGTKLAHYEITAHLGSGGMGDVYQATDTKLARSVAIKFLPEAFSHDTERVARFQREARVLASLNHANIAAIHGVEEIDTRHFLVMELVPGETLADRIKRGAIPIEEVLPIAKQIAEALEEAHEKGIIHRDLKPANIKITPDGKVKVLDFGLAKAYEPDQTDAALSNSPTLLSMAASNGGVILGTAAYMSPEQAKGKLVDKRADIWAFGVVLYEMLTGSALFSGETVSETMAFVMTKEPDWTALPANTPWRLQRLLHRCLRKDTRHRLQAIGEARIAIEEVQSGSATAILRPRSGHQGRDRLWMSALVVISLIAAILAVISVRHLRESPPAVPPEMRTDIVTPATGDPLSFALSPDGKQIVYSAPGEGGTRLWVRSLASTTAQPLAETEGATFPFWSPDSKSIGFFAGGKLKRLDIGGGQPQVLANATFGRGGTWNPEGVILFCPNPGGILFRVSATGGEVTAVTKLDEKQISHRFPHFLPASRQFLFFVNGSSETRGIYLGSLDSPETRRLTFADAGGAYLTPGWLVWIQGGTLRAQRLDITERQLVGDPVTLADAVAYDPVNFVAGFSVSDNGMMAYRAGSGSQRRQLAWFDRTGKPLGVLGMSDENNMVAPRLSPDGLLVAVFRLVQGNQDIWLLDGTRTSRFTFDAALDQYPVWSPDGGRIVFASTRKGRRNLYIKPSGGAGVEELLVESAQDKIADDWSHDGRFLLFSSLDPQTALDLWVLPVNGDRKPWVFLKTNFEERYGQFSPDGHWVAYQSNESGREEVYVRPFAEGGSGPGLWQVSTAGGGYPEWRPDGKELYYIALDGKMMGAPVTVNGIQLEPGTPEALFQTHIVGGGPDAGTGRQYDISRDGRFLINTVPEDATASPITILQNWKPPAK